MDSLDFVAVDRDARFHAFQRELARRFGGRPPPPSSPAEETESRAESTEERLVRRLGERFEGSWIFAWYRTGVGVYERVEGLVERVETSTRWATGGVRLDADIESVADGKAVVHFIRSVGAFDVGFEVEDAIDGRFGLRFGGIVRNHRLHVDVSGMGDSPRLTFRLKRLR